MADSLTGGVILAAAAFGGVMWRRKVATGYYFPEAAERYKKNYDDIPLQILRQVHRAKEWEDLDVIEKNRLREKMGTEEKAAHRESINSLRKWGNRLPKGKYLADIIKYREDTAKQKDEGGERWQRPQDDSAVQDTEGHEKWMPPE